MELLIAFVKGGLIGIAVFLLLFFAFGLLLVEELSDYCKKEIDYEAWENKRKEESECQEEN